MIPAATSWMDRLAVGKPSGSKAGSARLRGRVGPGVAVVLVALTSLGSVAGSVDSYIKQRHQFALLGAARDAEAVLQGLMDGDLAIHDYLTTGAPAAFSRYCIAVAGLRPSGRTGPRPQLTNAPLFQQITQQISHWDAMAAKSPGADSKTPSLASDGLSFDTLRDGLGSLIEGRIAESRRREAALNLEQQLLMVLDTAGGALAVLALIYAVHGSGREAAKRGAAMAEALRSREQAIAGREEVRQIFAMAETLQSANGLADGGAILRSSAMSLMPDLGGALYVFSHLRDRLDLAIAWHPWNDNDMGQAAAAPDFLVPGECWALKRSKPHLNGHGAGALRCCHAPAALCSLEVPMIGRGEPVGLLVFHAAGESGEARLIAVNDVASVLADSMSLALSSIMLRDKLRNQAVRDSLTGLYNRRFLEEVLHGLALQAQRRQSPLSAIMIDLDHFKRLNDEHGHAMGDTVLKGAGATIGSLMRGSDVACRYGGEEFVVLMPDCTLDMAQIKAEQLRERIARLTRDGGPQVSASFGVATIPLTARDAEELLASADAALYRAKQGGRNRVALAQQIPAVRELGEWKHPVTLSSIQTEGLRLAPSTIGRIGAGVPDALAS